MCLSILEGHMCPELLSNARENHQAPKYSGSTSPELP